MPLIEDISLGVSGNNHDVFDSSRLRDGKKPETYDVGCRKSVFADANRRVRIKTFQRGAREPILYNSRYTIWNHHL